MPFYVGYGFKERAYKEFVRNGHHTETKKKYGLSRFVVFETNDVSLAKFIECLLIRVLKTKRGEPGHWGTNLTWGGEGTHGLKLTEEQKHHLYGPHPERTDRMRAGVVR
jgi:hypothetical protein